MAQNFDQYLAESGRQSTLDELRRTGQYDKAKSQYESSGFYGSQPWSQSFSSPSSNFNFQDAVKQAIEMNRQANQPAIQSLEASIPEQAQKFEAERQKTSAQIEPLKQRYQSLLDEVSGKAKASEEAQTRITSGELAKRGIVGSSTLAQQEVQNAVEPIRSGARTAATNIGIEREQGLQNLQNIISNLTGQETEAQRAVRNAIAQLQSGAAQSGITQGMNIYQQQQQQALQQAEIARQQALQDAENRRVEQLFPIQLQQARADLASKLAANKNASTQPITPFGSTNTGEYNSNPLSWTGGSWGANVVNLLNQGKVKEAYDLYKNA